MDAMTDPDIDPQLVDLVRIDSDGRVLAWISVFRTQSELIASYLRRGYIRCDVPTLEAAQRAMRAGRPFGERVQQSAHSGHLG